MRDILLALICMALGTLLIFPSDAGRWYRELTTAASGGCRP